MYNYQALQFSQGAFSFSKALLTSQKSQLYKILALIDLILCNEYMIIQGN